MSIATEAKYVLFSYEDGTNFVIKTSTNISLVPKLEPGCLFDLILGINIPISQFEMAKRTVLDEYPEQFRKESEYYGTLLKGINEVFR